MPPRHWLHPQTVPRGFLRLYILTLLSRGPQTGYSIIQRIDERTDGAWKPGPGTMYPLLKDLLKEGLVRVASGDGKGASKSYALTRKGGRELEKVRNMIAGAGRKEPVMSRLFSELLPGALFFPMMMRRYRDNADVFREKISEVPEAQRWPLLRELRLLTESQMAWIDSQLDGEQGPVSARKKADS